MNGDIMNGNIVDAPPKYGPLKKNYDVKSHYFIKIAVNFEQLMQFQLPLRFRVYTKILI